MVADFNIGHLASRLRHSFRAGIREPQIPAIEVIGDYNLAARAIAQVVSTLKLFSSRKICHCKHDSFESSRPGSVRMERVI